NTRSPAWSWSRAGCEPLLYWFVMSRLSCLPCWCATYQTNPEQSKPLGLAPAQTYAAPSSFRAAPASPSVGAPGGGVGTPWGGFGAGFGVPAVAAAAAGPGVPTGAMGAADGEA